MIEICYVGGYRYGIVYTDNNKRKWDIVTNDDRYYVPMLEAFRLIFQEFVNNICLNCYYQSAYIVYREI